MSRETDLAWFAGIIDGEGCIRGYRTKVIKGKSGVNLSVTVQMTSKRTIVNLKRIAKMGTILEKKRVKHYRQIYVWAVWAQQGAKLLKEILPFLYTKQKQAKIFLKIAESMNYKKLRGRTSERERKWQDKFLKKLKDLKYIKE